MCRDNGLPIRVFDLTQPGALVRLANGDDIGTLVADLGTAAPAGGEARS